MPLKRILFIDDEMLLRMALVPGLEEAGYVVDEAGTGKRALEIFRERHLEICCAVIDVGLPDLRGDSMVAEFRALSAQIGVVLATGYGDIELQTAFSADPNVRVLAKPYFIDELLKAIGAVESLPAPGPFADGKAPTIRPE
ncbi:MAG: response regulator [Ferrovibrio sp.]